MCCICSPSRPVVFCPLHHNVMAMQQDQPTLDLDDDDGNNIMYMVPHMPACSYSSYPECSPQSLGDLQNNLARSPTARSCPTIYSSAQPGAIDAQVRSDLARNSLLCQTLMRAAQFLSGHKEVQPNWKADQQADGRTEYIMVNAESCRANIGAYRNA